MIPKMYDYYYSKLTQIKSDHEINITFLYDEYQKVPGCSIFMTCFALYHNCDKISKLTTNKPGYIWGHTPSLYLIASDSYSIHAINHLQDLTGGCLLYRDYTSLTPWWKTPRATPYLWLLIKVLFTNSTSYINSTTKVAKTWAQWGKGAVRRRPRKSECLMPNMI